MTISYIACETCGKGLREASLANITLPSLGPSPPVLTLKFGICEETSKGYPNWGLRVNVLLTLKGSDGSLEGPTRKPRRASVFSTHSGTQAAPAFHCIRMCKRHSFDTRVFKTH